MTLPIVYLHWNPGILNISNATQQRFAYSDFFSTLPGRPLPLVFEISSFTMSITFTKIIY